MTWLTWTLVALAGLAGLFLLLFVGLLIQVFHRYYPFLIRAFREKPLFIVPRGQPVADAENVRFTTRDGLSLAGSYLRTTLPQRKGVVLFGAEFGSDRWSCLQYCGHLRAAGYDLFTFEFRNQGESAAMPGYEPLQWVTDFEIRDMRAAIAYLKQRPDADPRGIGIFGVSRGGGAGIFAAAREPSIRCIMTDGAFATRTTMIPHMRKWIGIVSNRLRLQRILPNWFYVLVARIALWDMGRRFHCRYLSMERAIAKLVPRSLFMVHGGGDTYIKPDSAQQLFDRAAQPKEFWLVEKAKHNQALHVAGEEPRRMLAFFDQHLAIPNQPAAPAKEEPTALARAAG